MFSNSSNTDTERVLTQPPTSLEQRSEPSGIARALAVVEREPDRYATTIEPEWQVIRGPNGGYLGALLLAAMTKRLGDGRRRPRVLTAHFPRVPQLGAIEIQTRLLRTGRSMTWLGAELYQGEDLCVTATAAFSTPWPSVNYAELSPPTVPALGEALHLPAAQLPPFAQNFEYHSTFGSPFAPSAAGAVGGYIRPAAPIAYSPPVLTMISDAWYPSTFARGVTPVMAATLDLTVHFRDYAAIDALPLDAYALSVFRSRLAAEGFFEEDGEIWDSGGRLLAQSRQLAIAAPLRG